MKMSLFNLNPVLLHLEIPGKNIYKLLKCEMFRPAPKRVEKVMGKYDFDGSDPDDLPFKKGELLTVVSKVFP